MIVRSASVGDIPVIAGFQTAMASETEHIELNRETVGRGVTAVFEKPERGSYYVAESDGRVVGSLLTTYEWSDWRNGTVLWIQSVYVLPEYRRQGIYKAMYSHIRELVHARPDLFGIRLYADVSNTAAHQVYTSLGMKQDHYVTFEWMKP
jgi:GNAT superfamily N-acetyltransferase